MDDVIIIGIDPGLYGALAILQCENQGSMIRYVVYDLRFIDKRYLDVDMLHSDIFINNDTSEIPRIFLEEVHAMPKEGVSSSFKFGFICGQLQAALVTVGDVFPVAPQRWKKALGLLKQGKKGSLRLARQLFPHADLHLAKHDGRAEALLIAEYGRQQLFADSVGNDTNSR